MWASARNERMKRTHEKGKVLQGPFVIGRKGKFQWTRAPNLSQCSRREMPRRARDNSRWLRGESEASAMPLAQCVAYVSPATRLESSLQCTLNTLYTSQNGPQSVRVSLLSSFDFY